MSSINSLSSGNDPFQSGNYSALVQFVNNFNAIGNALQSGNLSDAQAALATFQSGLPGGASSQEPAQPFGSNSAANTDFSNLSSALKSGNLTSAQQAYSTLQEDLQSTSRGRSGRHHHHSTANASTDTAASSSTVTTSASTTSSGPLLDLQA